MSMEHKAFAFDWSSFTHELAPILLDALSSQHDADLAGFVDTFINRLCDPYEGDSLNADWQSQLETGDIQEIADFALTAYYDPSADFGLAHDWVSIDDGSPLQLAFLGRPFGPASCYFDPGRMGAYFQTPNAVQESLVAIRDSTFDRSDYFQLLQDCAQSNRGIYVTF